MHFFALDVAERLRPHQTEMWRWAEVVGEDGIESYLGFIVLRPLQHAPLGRTNLRPPPQKPGVPRTVLVSPHEANLLGQRMKIECMPFIQQDAKVGACAQAAMWMAGRYNHCLRREGWHSVADITRFATDPIDASLSTGLPAGADGLRLDHIARAFRRMGYQPQTFAVKSDAVRPIEIVARYVDSGIPPVLGLDLGEPVGHAVTVVGMEFHPHMPASARSVGDCVRSFLVHDDQRGCYLRLYARASDADPNDPDALNTVTDGTRRCLTVEDNFSSMIIALPSKVFLPGEKAETAAAGLFRSAIAQNGGAGSKLKALSDAAAWVNEGLMVRTYLTTGESYKRSIARAKGMPPTWRKEILLTALPRYVWVSEMRPKTAGIEPLTAPMVGHVVIDATSASPEYAGLITAIPGLMFPYGKGTPQRDLAGESYSFPKPEW
ncbi:hypothetical protein MTBUT4_220004 [Magnetospirillum sp. UT-4]|nr:hypothetical protein MTBUT4_220004 [Magnetospirillum sp. UT-4]